MRLIATIILLLIVAPAQAQEKPAQETQAPENGVAPRRTLKGHTYLLPATIDSAFVQTTFTSRTSVRYEVINDVPIGIGTVDLNALGARELFDFTLALGDIWEVGVTGFGQFLAGTNGRTLATQGALYGYGGSLKGAVRIARIESSGTQIGASVQVIGAEGGTRLSLLPLIRAVRSDPLRSIPEVITNVSDTLTTPVKWLDFAASVNIAQTITRALSLQGSFRLDLQRLTRSPFVVGQGRTDVSTTTWIPSGGVAVGVNPVDFPMGFMGEYRLSALNSDDLTSLTPHHILALGAYYSERPNLQLGPVFFGEFGLLEVDGVDVNGNPTTSKAGKAFAGQMMITYYW